MYRTLYQHCTYWTVLNLVRYGDCINLGTYCVHTVPDQFMHHALLTPVQAQFMFFTLSGTALYQLRCSQQCLILMQYLRLCAATNPHNFKARTYLYQLSHYTAPTSALSPCTGPDPCKICGQHTCTQLISIVVCGQHVNISLKKRTNYINITVRYHDDGSKKLNAWISLLSHLVYLFHFISFLLTAQA